MTEISVSPGLEKHFNNNTSGHILNSYTNTHILLLNSGPAHCVLTALVKMNCIQAHTHCYLCLWALHLWPLTSDCLKLNREDIDHSLPDNPRLKLFELQQHASLKSTNLQVRMNLVQQNKQIKSQTSKHVAVFNTSKAKWGWCQRKRHVT